MTPTATPTRLDHALIPLDGSDLARQAILPARRLLVGVDAPRFTLLEVVDAIGPATERLRANALHELRREADALLEQVQRPVRCRTPRPEVPHAAPLVEHGRPVERILLAAAQVGAGFVSITSHGRSGLSRAVRGSVAEEVLRASPVPVLVTTPRSARPSAECRPYLRLLVPLDGSALAWEAVPLAARIASRTGAEVVLFRADLEGSPEAGCLEHAVELLQAQGVTRLDPLVASRVPSIPGAILEVVERCRVDLVVMASHGRSGFERLRLGSVTEAVLRVAPCPVLVARGPSGGSGGVRLPT